MSRSFYSAKQFDKLKYSIFYILAYNFINFILYIFMQIVDSYTDFWKRYVDFKGRTSRSGFWFYVLGLIVVSVITNILDYAIGQPIFTLLISLASIIPAIAIYTRRLHDINKSGWWQLIVLIPLVGTIVLIVWFCTKGDQDKNRFGANPIHAKKVHQEKAAV
jgi:uncharacterized membrane protein YhaH (DUF805 family)